MELLFAKESILLSIFFHFCMINNYFLCNRQLSIVINR